MSDGGEGEVERETGGRGGGAREGDGRREGGAGDWKGGQQGEDAVQVGQGGGEGRGGSVT